MYLLRVWLTTIVLSPVLLCLVLGIAETENSEGIFTYFSLLFVMILFGAFLSIPTVLVQYLVLAKLQSGNKGQQYIKIILSLLTIVGVSLSFYITEVNFAPCSGPIIYAFIMICSIWYFNNKKPEN